MAQVLDDDLFIVDRKGKTYKTTFDDLRESLNLEHDYTAEVEATAGGTVTGFTIDYGGTGFIDGQEYRAVEGSGLEFTFIATEVDGTGRLVDINITDNSAIETPPVTFDADPILYEGSVATAVFQGTSIPALPDGGSEEYNLRQLVTESDGSTYTNDSAVVRVSNSGGVFSIDIRDRGINYSDGVAYLEITDAAGNGTDGAPVDITVTDVGGSAFNIANIIITATEDGAVTDSARLTVTLGGVEKSIHLVPGRGIILNDLGDDPNGESQIEISSDLLTGGGDDNTSTDTAQVIVDDEPPTADVYNIVDGTLWYNLRDGRTYIAIAYVVGTDVKFDWIDASPSSFNDALRKNQDDHTAYNLRVERDDSLNPDGGSFYAYHFNLEELPLIS